MPTTSTYPRSTKGIAFDIPTTSVVRATDMEVIMGIDLFNILFRTFVKSGFVTCRPLHVRVRVMPVWRVWRIRKVDNSTVVRVGVVEWGGVRVESEVIRTVMQLSHRVIMYASRAFDMCIVLTVIERARIRGGKIVDMLGVKRGEGRM
mmetsp:Transcript_2786/g.5735  ORF Transcript_2786/g.5735 Transcript_2786/m.5735 type:complete len:148 (+) Transcript_2786:171-614(+)